MRNMWFLFLKLNAQIENEILAPVLGYGLLKERIAALVTDGLRARLLESQGYDTQILEFIDMEHTPKNILIRAVKRAEGAAEEDGRQEKTEGKKRAAGRKTEEEKRRQCAEEYDRCASALHADLTLARLLGTGVSPAEAYRKRREGGEG